MATTTPTATTSSYGWVPALICKDNPHTVYIIYYILYMLYIIYMFVYIYFMYVYTIYNIYLRNFVSFSKYFLLKKNIGTQRRLLSELRTVAHSTFMGLLQNIASLLTLCLHMDIKAGSLNTLLPRFLTLMFVGSVTVNI